MTEPTNPHAWVFVSHSSEDLARVRRVRNYLESKGASPILFHLLALQDPEDFWPLIKKEIAARNFFLYCESRSAATNEWVQREREAVEAVRREKPVRIGHVNVDRPNVDKDGLNSFLSTTRVFPSYAPKDRVAVQPFLKALNEAGFRVFRESWSQRIDRDLDVDRYELEYSAHYSARPERQLAAQEGWVVAFLSSSSQWEVLRELQMAEELGTRLVPVALESLEKFPVIPPQLPNLQYLDATLDPTAAPQRLVNELLSRHVPH